jgi:hypothetical protein
MPISQDPNGGFKYVLKSDREKPQEKQPWFKLRARSRAAVIRFEEEIEKLRRDKKKFQDYIELLREAVLDWGNMAGPDGVEIAFDKSKLEEILTDGEIGELLWAYRMQGWLPDERKNSGSQSGSDSEPAAKEAAPGQTSAQTGPQPAVQ